MELRDYLEIGAKKAGSLTALGLRLGLSQPRMSHSKAHKEPLPIDAVCKLATFIEVELKTVIAANELVTEKKEEKREFWKGLLAKAASFMIAALLTLLSVTFIVTDDANATEKTTGYNGRLSSNTNYALIGRLFQKARRICAAYAFHLFSAWRSAVLAR